MNIDGLSDADLGTLLEEHLLARRQGLDSKTGHENPLLPSLLNVVTHLDELSRIARPSGPDESFPERIGKYEVIRCVGRGGQSRAFLAWDPDLQRNVVIKLYRHASSEAVRQSILAEGRSLTKLSSPYIVRCFAVDHFDGAPYLVLEHVQGTNLAELMRSLRPSYQASAEIVARIAEGLVEVHAAGLLHRDIKPSNVVVDNDGVPKLIDFGLAAKFEDPAGRTRIGTPSYMAPEQARQDWDCMDHRTDVFSLGAVLYQLLSGKPIYTGPDKQSLIRNAQDCSIVPLRQLRPDLPRALTELCTQCLASHPLQRPKSAAELARRLRASVRYRYSPWVVAALMSIAIAMLVISLGFLRPTTSWNSQPLNSNLVDDVTTALPMPQSSIGLIAASSDDSNSLHQADSTRIDDLDWRQLHHLFTGAEMQPKAAQLQQAMDMETTAVASVDDTRAPPLSAADFWERLSRDFDSSVPKLRLENEFRVEIEISRNEDGMNDGLPRSIAYWDLKESWQPTRRFDFFVADQRVRSNVSLEIRVSAEEDCFIAIYGITIPPSTVGDAPNMEPTIDLVYPEQNVFKHASSFPAVKGVELGLTTGVDLLYVMCSTDVFDLNEPRKSDALGRSNDLRGFVRGRKISQRLYRYVVKSLDR